MTRFFAPRVLVVTLLLSPGALGQSYDALLLDGVAARDRAMETGNPRDWQRAAQHFARARELKSTKEAEFEFAEAALQTERWVEAYEAYEVALELGLQGRAAARAQEYLTARAAEITRLQITGPQGARVYVDAQPRALLPLRRPLVVRLGSSEVRVEHGGYASWKKQLAITALGVTSVEVELEPLLAPPVATAFEPTEPVRTTLVEPPPWAAPVAVVGGSLFVVAGASALVTYLMLPGARDELRGLCAEFQDDECTAAAPARRNSAQSVANRIETLENLRLASLLSAGVGLIGATAGVVPLLTTADTSTAQRGSFHATAQGVWIEWNGQF